MPTSFLVTGCTQGLGHAVTLELSRKGHKIYAVGRNKSLLENLALISPNIHPIIADIATESERNEIQRQIDPNTPISIIHNAAIAMPELFKNLTEDLLRKHFETNYFAPLLLTHKFLPLLRGQRVLHITSAAADMALPGLMQYSISKSALEHATRCLNNELNDSEIHFANLRPGMLDTSMQAGLRNANVNSLPGREFYLQAANENKLIDPEIAAKFVIWVMLEVETKSFSKTDWSIYDNNYHKNWLVDHNGNRLKF